MEIHEKILQKYFDQIISGKKTYEIRKIEEGEEYVEGESNFVLHEIDNKHNKTGRTCRCIITSYLSADEINEVCGKCINQNYAIIGIRPVQVCREIKKEERKC